MSILFGKGGSKDFQCRRLLFIQFRHGLQWFSKSNFPVKTRSARQHLTDSSIIVNHSITGRKPNPNP